MPLFENPERNYRTCLDQSDNAIESIISLVGWEAGAEGTPQRKAAEYVEKTLVRRSIQRFIQDAFIFPASEADHDAHAGGLVSHTLEVIIHALEWTRGQTQQFGQSERLALFALCLIHDASKIWLYEVDATAPRVDKPRWGCHNLRLLQWIDPSLDASQQQREKITAIKVELVPKERRPPYRMLEPAAAGTLHRYISESLPDYVGVRNYAEIIIALAKGAPESKLDLYSGFKAADRRSAMSPHGKEDEQAVSDAVRELLVSAIAGISDWNGPSSSHLASESHCILGFPMKGDDLDMATPFRDSLVFIRDIVGIAPDAVKGMFLNYMQRACVHVAQTGDNAHDIPFTCTAGTRTFTAIAFPWEDFIPAKHRPPLGTQSIALRFRSRHGKREDIDPVTFGFSRLAMSDSRDLLSAREFTRLWSLVVTTARTAEERAIAKTIADHGHIPSEHRDLATDCMIRRLHNQADRTPEHRQVERNG